MRTQAVVFPGPQRIELREVALVEPGPGDVVVRTAYTSISAGTERMLLDGRMPHPALQFPVVPGYETVGQVAWCGADAPQLEGQWVYVGGARCYLDANPAWGGQARELVVPHDRVVPLGDLPPEQGVLLALTATALHGIDLAEVGPGRRVLVLGQGPVGQLAARIARERGAWVAVLDRAASRLQRSEADLVLGTDEDWRGRLGAPADLVVEATGSMEALAGALPALAVGGTILLLGYYETLMVPYMQLFLKEARLLTAREWRPGDLARSRDMLASGGVRGAALLTHRRPVAQIEDAYATALGDPDCLKLLLDWRV